MLWTVDDDELSSQAGEAAIMGGERADSSDSTAKHQLPAAGKAKSNIKLGEKKRERELNYMGLICFIH